MELSFRREYRDGAAVDVLRVKSDHETFFVGQTTVETPTSILVVKDVFDVVEKTRHSEDADGNSYDWYLVRNHYRTEERFTPEKQDAMDQELEDHASKIDYIAMMTDVDIEEV